jgi:hypothetical protein
MLDELNSDCGLFGPGCRTFSKEELKKAGIL